MLYTYIYVGAKHPHNVFGVYFVHLWHHAFKIPLPCGIAFQVLKVKKTSIVYEKCLIAVKYPPLMGLVVCQLLYSQKQQKLLSTADSAPEIQHLQERA